MIYLIPLILFAIAAYGVYHWWRQSQVKYMPPMPAALRNGLEFLYYGPVDGAEDHVSAAFEFNWGGAADTAEKMKRHGLLTWLTLSGECFSSGDFRPLIDAASRVQATFSILQAAGVLHQVKVLYPLDEPDLHGVSDAEMTAMCATVLAEAAKFPELSGVELATIYSMPDGNTTLPGIGSMNRVAYDNYGLGSNILVSKPFETMVARLRPDQTYLLVPGGGDPWRQDPEAFRRWAHSHPQCSGIVAFMLAPRYDDPKNPTTLGIGTNGMADKYRALGLEFTKRN